ncbi:MAG TPA: carboxypeptidase regulatory-like domain-containing protein [Bryobacteraceae bacterium]|nr:carboxypeptidase regulatory-like domain-containing protein [Bryobacteraceae bacterium]
MNSIKFQQVDRDQVDRKVGKKRKLLIWTALGAGVAIFVTVFILRVLRIGQVALVTGAVLEADTDPRKQQPISAVTITAQSGEIVSESKSDASGLFRLPLRPTLFIGESIRLVFRHRDYEPFETTTPAANRIHVIRLTPKAREAQDGPPKPPTTVANIRVRYAVKETATSNVGSTVKTFEVINTGNIPCDRKAPCSPDRKWKAAVGSLSIDAGDDKQFRNARIACIAGPCPFTRIDSNEYVRNGRVFNLTVRNWSDSVTFLVQAEVTRTMLTEIIRYNFPAIFDRSMSFTLPATAQGPAIEAEVGGTSIVYPLGPSLKLSWANCSMELEPDRTKLFRCELKPDYTFQ